MAVPLHELRAQLQAPDAVLADAVDRERYAGDRSRLRSAAPLAVVRPASVAEVQAVVRWARAHSVALVPAGGRTGLCGGTTTAAAELLVSMERMNQCLDHNLVDQSVTVQAGMVTAQVQAVAADMGLHFPVDFASSGSSQIGGNVATNAGGIHVIRYGMLRDWVRGMTVVTGAGEVLELHQGLIKNNAGYDFRHLLIGSEGTLGIICELTLGLTHAPIDSTVALLGLPALESATQILPRARATLPITAFEFFCARSLKAVQEHTGAAAPLTTSCPYYLLLEYEGAEQHQAAMLELFEDALEQGQIIDGVIAGSGVEARRLWGLRENISESLSPRQPYKNDLSVRVSQLPDFVAAAQALCAEQAPALEVAWFGHIGDGNLHINVLPPPHWDMAHFERVCADLAQALASLLHAYGGSVSAEHGIGMLKKAQLGFTRSAAEVALMQGVKAVFDPDGILNPGKIFDVPMSPELAPLQRAAGKT